MAPPAKRPKLNSSKSSPAKQRGLDYFFSKQKGGSPAKSSQNHQDAHAEDTTTELTDEQLARKLQAQWDEEDAGSSTVAVPRQDDIGSPLVASEQLNDDVPITDTDNAEQRQDNKAGEIPSTVSMGTSSFMSKDSSSSNLALKVKNNLALQSAVSEEDSISSGICFDESPLTFDPHKYLPDLQKQWAGHGGNASYALVIRCFVLVNSTQSRIKIVDTLVNLLRTIIEGDPSSLLPTVWLATNAISPPYISLELGLGGSAISKALKQACGLDSNSLKALYNKVGDAGDVAFEAKKRQTFTLRKPKPLTIKTVYDSLVQIATVQGTGSGERKQRIVDKLLQDARGPEESRYLVRTLCQHLRIGAVKTTMLIALSRAFLLSRPTNAEFSLRSQAELSALKKDSLAEVWSKAEETVKACFAKRPNYSDLVPALLEIGVCDELPIRCGLGLHVPLMPMLGNITRDLSEMLTKLQGRDFSCEFKYDGQRAQVHCDANGKVSIFSRHLELMTDKYPDLVALIPKIRGDSVNSFILEGEVVAVDRDTGDLKTFQTLTNRARKDVAIGSITIDVCLFAFDLMYLNGEPLLDRPFRERRSLLRSLFVELPRHFTWVQNMDATSQDSETILEFFKSATDAKCEGIMVKILDNLPDPSLDVKPEDEETVADADELQASAVISRKGKQKKNREKEPEKEKRAGRRKALLSTYEPDKRLDSWLKVKKDYSATFDSLDLIPIAGWHGQGRKSKFWSPILLAVRNETTGSLEAVCKCISGFTDNFYKANKEFYDEDGPNVLDSKPSYIDYTGGYPDVWFEPKEVWEMAFADITISPVYTAAIGLLTEDKGVSLRFPRFLKKREDKGIDEASTSDFLAGLWRKQEVRVTKEVQNDVGNSEE
ncbi:hypothetical protein VC83_04585 [Pseudogymnoascus destructans]|uniref:DNA ligase n=2 Tax=Pseudogymnoascus destructans TaxID=655981 RepID=L8GC84_PSED2|nr:uncharacterized protein VC83_04585 [Pseudogymnoascus destructans]ELR10283.1 hypothetical protein GMDG_04669 [Pseudogymnoascus destructans 20631-21]OAF57291.1 hypothetical protein VC83_04585 [Pseudogymnoascus destructans]